MSEEKAPKPKRRRAVSKKRLYKALTQFCEEENINGGDPVDTVLGALRDAIVDEALES